MVRMFASRGIETWTTGSMQSRTLHAVIVSVVLYWLLALCMGVVAVIDGTVNQLTVPVLQYSVPEYSIRTQYEVLRRTL